MSDTFQRLFARPGPQVLSMNAQAALGPVRAPQRSQFAHLLRHFLERFFSSEAATQDSDAKTRAVQIACATGLPPFVIALYLWPTYHPFPGWPIGQDGGPPPYWLQVDHHLFFVLYSFVALGIATVFLWDRFFPDLLDLFVLGPLPIAPHRAFRARVAAIVLLLGGFLLDANVFATAVLPLATDPPSLARYLAAHVLATGLAGLFAAALVLALEGLLIAVCGERIFRRLALPLQGVAIAAFVILLLLFPVLTGVVPTLLESGSLLTRCFPPFWFLGIYQRLLEGPAARPIYAALAQTGALATAAAVAMAVVVYPLAYARRLRALVEGASARRASAPLLLPLHRVLHATLLRPPVRRAVFHFIGQTLSRVPRYRIYLVLYGGVGVSVVAAGILRFTTERSQAQVSVAADGLRAALAIVIFWTIAGLRMAFGSAGNERARWIFRIVLGNPPQTETRVEQLRAAYVWVLLAASIVALSVGLGLHVIAPPELRTTPAMVTQLVLAATLCVVLTDAFFLNVLTVAFSGEVSREPPNLAFTVLKFFTFFPLVAALPVILAPWMEASPQHLVVVAIAAVGAHLALRHHHRSLVRDHCSQRALEEDEEDFPMRLGLRS